MKKLHLLAFPVAAGAFAVTLAAADFWESKSFTDWSERDVQKMLKSSPWSKPFSVALAGSNGTVAGRRAGSMNSEGGGTTKGPATGSDPGSLTRVSAGDPGAESGPNGVPTMNLIVRWQSAMPVREAIVKAKYGNEAATSAEAKKLLEGPVEHYIISVGGLPKNLLPGDADELRKQMLAQCTLSVKGKDPIKPVDFMVENGGHTTEAMFAFPKTTPITEDDKEVEFMVRIGGFNIRQKFRLKDMLVNGKLDL